MSRRKTTCEGCGCNCKDCSDSVGSLHLHVEIENLKQRLLERENHIVSMETNFLREAEKFPNGEMAALTDELLTWQDKYSRLYESHKRVQKVNQNLEDKLLRIVDKCETEKNILTAEVAALTRRLVDEKFNVSKLQEENERYRNDVNLAIQLLQCKPSNFVPQKYDSLPNDLQQKVRSYVSSKRRVSVSDNQQKPPEVKTIKVPIPTFPPTAMVYSVNKLSNDKESGSGGGNGNGEEKSAKQSGMDIVSAAIMAKVLEERERERSQMRHCDTCTCPTATNTVDNSRQTNKQTQTVNDFNVGNLINSSNELTVSNANKVDLKEHQTGCNVNNSCAISSPMNVKCKPPSIVNVPINVLGMVPLAEKTTKDSETVRLDFFSEFNMSPVVESAVTMPCNGKKPSNRIHNAIKLDSDVTVCSNRNDSDFSPNRSCRVVLENTRNFSSSPNDNDANDNDNINNNVGCKDVSDESDNLIIFDKPVPLSTNTQPVAATNPTSGLTVLGGNFNVNAGSGNKSGSVRHCSVRLQAGSSNILLDNVVDGPYAPVLYKSRPQSTYDPLLVHTSPPRSVSASDSVSPFFNDDRTRYPVADGAIPNNMHSSSSSTYSNSSSSSTPSSSSSSLRKSNLTLAQIRTETEI